MALPTDHSRREVRAPGEFAGQAALVTGASGEIGGAIAAFFLRADASVVWVGRDRGRLEARARGLCLPSGHSLFVRADVRRERDVCRAVESAIKRFGRIDILVNNAGARGPTAPIHRLGLKQWREVLDTNLTGAFLCSRECLRHMARRRQGRIVNISTVVSRWAYPLRAAYAASKAGLNSLTMTLAQEAGAVNVQVNAICPGPVAGQALDGVIAARAKALRIPVPTMRAQFMRPAALRRAVVAEDVAHAVLFLCSRAARNITGQIIDVSAGYGIGPGV
ncbi:MAG: SDR family NAD(P)-dependent oxidoreductase [Terriglobia bacterium]